MKSTPQTAQPSVAAHQAKPSRLRRGLARLWTHPYFPVFVIILLNLAIGSLIVTDFGESWDEQLRQRYAEDSLAAYRGEATFLKDDKGPFYVITALLGSQLLRNLNTGWLSIDGWHFMHFLSFQLAIFCLYDLARRLVSRPAATGATLLFSTQPLLWGHAFINPKDIPLMAFFLASVSSGLWMIRTLESQPQTQPASQPAPPVLQSRWLQLLHADLALPTGRRAAGWVLAGLIMLAGFFPLLARSALQRWIANLIFAAYHAQPGTLLGEIFDQLASNKASLPVELYVQKAMALYIPLSLGTALLALALTLLLLSRLLPRSAERAWETGVKPVFRRYLQSLGVPALLLAGIVLGFTTSIRFFGPLAGGMVALYLLSRRGVRAFVPLAAYITVALLVTYAAWPALWNAPWRAFSRSLSSAANFTWEGQVLFGGIEYPLDSLPANYLPTLLAIQLSEPTLILFFAGLGVALYRIWRGEGERVWYAILAAWFFLPVLGFVALTPNTYDNFRHLMFILPPVFLYGGLALEGMFRLISRPWLRYGLLAAVLMPNLAAIVQLHPYSYIYYNSLAGGVSGAFRQYETDYWATSYREAALYLNEHASANANVIVWGPDHIVAHYIRSDLQIIEFRKAGEVDLQGETYAVLSSRHEKDRTLYVDYPIVNQVARRGAVLAVVKKIR